MNKVEIKKILLSMRTAENENIVNNLLGKIDLLTDEKLAFMVDQIGDSEENIRSYLQRRIAENQKEHHEEHIHINEMFTYGLTNKSIHLHMPIDLHQMISENGLSKTMDIVNLQLLDAIERIRKLQNEGYYKFLDKDNIYMISPLLVGRELKFLSDLDFKTQMYKRKELQDEEFIKEHPEAMLAINIFGKENRIGTATIGLDVINSEEWQEKKESTVKSFEENGIKLKTEEKEKSKA